MARRKSRIVICAQYYVPSSEGGGAVRSIANLVEFLGDQCEFRVVTGNRDCASRQRYNDVKIGVWQQVGKARVFYLSRSRKMISQLFNLLRGSELDAVYLNSFFSPWFSIVPMILMHFGMVDRKPVIIAPRGELAPAALAIKRWKKSLYLYLSRKLGLYRSVSWHVSDEQEGRDVCAIFEGATLRIAGNLAIAAEKTNEESPPCRVYVKQRGVLNAVFLSRIVPIKNLDGALRLMQGLRGQVNFTIYGPVEDRGYWRKCESIIESLPTNVRVRYEGAIQYFRVADVLEKYDLFVLLSHSENYGHVIIESLMAGCPVLISDQTPWQNLEARGVGWDIPLDQTERFTEILQNCIDVDAEGLQWRRRRAMVYGRQKAGDEETFVQNRNLFTFLSTGSR